MLRLVSIVVLCVLLVAAVSTAYSDSWIGRAGAGVIGEVASVGVVGAGVLGLYMASHLNFNDETSWGPAALGLLILVPGMPAATAGGVCIAGNIQEQDGRYWAAYLGGLAGLPVGFGVVCLGTLALGLSPYVAVPLYMAGAVAPAVGATIGYDLSRSRGVESDVWQKRLIPPTVAVVPERRVGRARTTRIDARLLAVRF
jgi:hypothetical protein